jgi:hypothetical protein
MQGVLAAFFAEFFQLQFFFIFNWIFPGGIIPRLANRAFKLNQD